MLSINNFYYNIDSGKIYLLKFHSDTFVISASIKAFSLEDITDFLKEFNRENPSPNFGRGNYIYDGEWMYLTLHSEKGSASFDAQIRGKEFIIFEIINHITGEKLKRKYNRYGFKKEPNKSNIDSIERASAIQSNLNLSRKSEYITSNEMSFKQGFYRVIIIVSILLFFFTCASRRRYGATCSDGTSSGAISSGACSHHGGVRYWKHKYWWD